MSEENKYILEVKDLHTSFFTDAGEVKAVNGISFNLEPGKTLGIVGESGSGKSVFTKTFAGMLDSNGFIDNGKIISDGNKNIVVGFGMPGLKDSLNLSSEESDKVTIPESLSIEDRKSVV